jgi:hypothetical protein
MLETLPKFPEALTLPQQARAIVIKDQESYTAAANLKITFAGWRKKITEEFAPMKDAAHKAHKAITEKEKEYLAPVTEAEAILVGGIKRFQEEQERLRRIEQQRLEAIARAEAEVEAKRRREEAEAIRKQEEEARLNEAIATGVDEVAPLPPVEAYMEPAPYVAPVVAAPTYEKVVGTGIRRTWGARVTDIKALCRAIAAGEVPENYIEPNMTALNGRARSDKSMMRIPGVIAEEK